MIGIRAVVNAIARIYIGGFGCSLAAAKELVDRIQAAIYEVEVSSEVTQRRPLEPEE